MRYWHTHTYTHAYIVYVTGVYNRLDNPHMYIYMYVCMYVQLNPRVSQLHWQETLQHSCRLLLEVNPRMSASYLYLPERSQHRCRLLLYKHAYSYAYLCCDTHWSRDIDAEDDQRFHSTTSSLLRVDRSGCYHKRGVILGWDFLRFQLCHIYCTTKLTLPSLQYQPEFCTPKKHF